MIDGFDYREKLKRQVINSNTPCNKLYLTYLYNLVYEELKDQQLILEVGSGAGISKSFLPTTDIYRTDVLEFSENQVKGDVDCSKLPFPNESFNVILAVDTLHHLESPLMGLREIKRVTKFKSGGKIIIVEPFVSHLSYLVYRLFHFERTSNPLLSNYKEPFATENLEDGDQALTKLLFVKKSGRIKLQELFPDKDFIVKFKTFSVLSFFIPGGLNNPFLINPIFVKITLTAEKYLPQFLLRTFASRCIITITKVK